MSAAATNAECPAVIFSYSLLQFSLAFIHVGNACHGLTLAPPYPFHPAGSLRKVNKRLSGRPQFSRVGTERKATRNRQMAAADQTERLLRQTVIAEDGSGSRSPIEIVGDGSLPVILLIHERCYLHVGFDGDSALFREKATYNPISESWHKPARPER